MGFRAIFEEFRQVGSDDGEAAGRVSLVLAGIVLSAFLFYVALSGPTVALLSRLRRRHRRPAAPVLSEVTGSVPPRS
jgi:hypothetical protein